MGAISLAKRQERALKQLLALGPDGMDALEPDLLTDLQSGLLQIQVQFDGPRVHDYIVAKSGATA